MKTNFKEVKIYDLDPIQFREDIIKHVRLLIKDLTKQLEPDKPEIWLTSKAHCYDVAFGRVFATCWWFCVPDTRKVLF